MSRLSRFFGLSLVAVATLLAACSKHPETTHFESKADKSAKPEGTAAMCKEHGVPEKECGICHPDLVAKLAAGQGVKVRLPSAESAKMVGVQTVAPERGVIAPGIDCLAEMEFNQNRLAQIAAPVGGIVQAVEVDLGAQVEEGQRVA